jgi:hypothetical protein
VVLTVVVVAVLGTDSVAVEAVPDPDDRITGLQNAGAAVLRCRRRLPRLHRIVDVGIV